MGRSADTILAQIVSSRPRIYCTSLLCFLIIFTLKLSFTLFMLHDPERHRGLAALDAAVAAALSAVIVHTLLTLFRDRKRRVLVYMRQVEELNHHVRNAVQALVLQFAANTKEEILAKEIYDAVHRIDAALKTAFPIVGERSRPLHDDDGKKNDVGRQMVA